MKNLNPPHGGELKNLMVCQDRAEYLRKKSSCLLPWSLTHRQQCDLEMLLTGGFSPLDGFMKKNDYDSVVESMRLVSGLLWPIPIVLDVDKIFSDKLVEGDRISLHDNEGVPLAVMCVDDIWAPDRRKEAICVYGTDNVAHSGVEYLMKNTKKVYLGGTITGIEYPSHHSFTTLRHTPATLRAQFLQNGWEKVVAFQTRNPMHRAHYELTCRAAQSIGAKLLLHPVVGMTKPGDVDYYTRVRCYQALLRNYPRGTVSLSILPLAMRMAGPREAMWHAIIRKNYGCTHFIVGRDHAGPGTTPQGEPFYHYYAAQELVKKYQDELGIEIIPFENMVYVSGSGRYVPESQVPKGSQTLFISGTELRNRLRKGLPIEEWFSFPEVIEELHRAFPERRKQGFTVFFTGLSGAGKSTIAKALFSKLMEIGSRHVTLLDGDIVRKTLSSELGFSREHRDLNIRRIGFVASEITKNRGIAICAPIAPYDATRKEIRQKISQCGGFILVHMSTPLDVCEKRDRKGLYAKARRGIIKEFTGISDPYETPEDADITINTATVSRDEATDTVFSLLRKDGYI